MTATMQDKVALVTGAGSGIGRATAQLFAAKGARVVVADVDVGGGEQTRELIAATGGEAVFIACDAAVEEQVMSLVDQAVSTFGRLDYAHNNAGIDGAIVALAEQSSDDYERVMAVNLKGVFLGMKYEIPVMMRQGGGAIVNTASALGLIGSAGMAPYVASKHGVNGLTKNAALEYAAAGIRVNALCPGVVRTPMIETVISGQPGFEQQILATTPLGRLAEPLEMAEVVVWLCSDSASYVTGHMLVADGGMIAQ